MRSNKIEAALPLFKTAVETKPIIEQFWLSYIEALITGNQLYLAKKVLKQGMQSKLSEAAVQFFDAEIHCKMGNLSEAKASYAKVIALKPDNVQAHNNLGVILQELGGGDEAEQSFRQAIALKSDFAQAHFNLGNAHKERGRLKEAEASYRQAITSTTGFTAAHRNLASTLRELGRAEQAIESEKYVKILNSSNIVSNELKQLSDNLSSRQPSPMEYPMHYRAGMGTENVASFLRSMAQMLRPKNILEIGAGYTTPFLLEALVNNERVYDDGNLEPAYFKNYLYDPKLVVIDNMSLGELGGKPGMNEIISSKYTEFIEGSFEGKANKLREKYEAFDFVWFDCGGTAEYKNFIDEYWGICSDYIFFHFTYTSGAPNTNHDIILNNMTGNPSVFDIIEPHKSRQGSITMVRKK
jgi:tetratricopeptide (TPR) repeat protein